MSNDIILDAIIDTSTLQDYIDTYTAVVDEAVLEFSDDNGVYGQPVDPANVAMVNQTLEPTAFESYSTSEFRVGVALSKLADYVGKIDSELVQLQFDNETRKFHIEGNRASFTMAAIDPDSVRDGQTPPEDTLDSMLIDVRMEGAALAHAVDVASMVSDHVIFDGNPDRDAPLHVIGRGDIDDSRVGFSDSLLEGSEVESEAESIYSEDYIEKLAGELPKDAEVRVRSGDEWPMAWDYDTADGHCHVQMFLAPRIQSR